MKSSSEVLRSAGVESAGIDEEEKELKIYCVTCERQLQRKSPELIPRHHEGDIEVPMCAKCHWAFHRGSHEVQKQMRKKVRDWISKQGKVFSV